MAELLPQCHAIDEYWHQKCKHAVVLTTICWERFHKANVRHLSYLRPGAAHSSMYSSKLGWGMNVKGKSLVLPCIFVI